MDPVCRGGGGKIYSIPCSADCFDSVHLKEKVELVLFSNRPRQNSQQGKKMETFWAPKQTRRPLCLCLCIHPSSMLLDFTQILFFWLYAALFHKYLREIEPFSKTILACLLGAQVGSIHEIKKWQIISWHCHFNIWQDFKMTWSKIDHQVANRVKYILYSVI